jgi:hypothetical protein
MFRERGSALSMAPNAISVVATGMPKVEENRRSSGAAPELMTPPPA